MFEAAEVGHRIDKERYKQESEQLRSDLLEAQLEMVERKKFPLIICIAGFDGAGKGETVNLLHEWMDPRHMEVHALGETTEEERARPPMWRYWRTLPPKGKTGIFFGSWYHDPLDQRLNHRISERGLDQSIGDILRFEQMLADEGALLLKFWFHLSKKAQKKRLKSLEEDPRTRWRITPQDWRNYDRYEPFYRIGERLVRATSTGNAPWHVVEGTDERYRGLTVGTILLHALQRRIAEEDKPEQERLSRRSGPTPAPLAPPLDGRTLVADLDLTRKLEKDDYKRQLEEQQGRLNFLTRHKHFKDRTVVAVFEGSDAAGKGGSIRRVTAALDARLYNVVPIAAPTDEEKAQPYLWRFWRHLPRHGRLVLFDRSWYGRVLVERVEGFAAEADWMRAYGEINDFEEQLHRANAVVVKFWLQVSKEEQLARFEERQRVEFKRFKITPEDWRNREKWDDYALAVNDMVSRTSTDYAPWTLVEANDKHYARVKIITTLCDRIEASL